MCLSGLLLSMKLQRRFNRKVGDKVYDKWIVVEPPGTVRDLGWKVNQELDLSAVGRTLTLRPAIRRKSG